MNASDLGQLLRSRHFQDVFFEEVLLGAQGSPRMDAWAMKRSWARPMTYGYEIKVARSDFLQDDKWPVYLDYCQQFYFVAPAGLIDPAEVPEHVGLLLASKTGSRLYTKKKAPIRDVEIPRHLLKALLIGRVVPGDPGYQGSNLTRPSAVDRWRKWVEDCRERKRIGWEVSRALADRVNEAEAEAARMREREARIEAAEGRLRELGMIGYYLDPAETRRLVDRQVAKLREALSPEGLAAMKAAHAALDRALEALGGDS